MARQTYNYRVSDYVNYSIIMGVLLFFSNPLNHPLAHNICSFSFLPLVLHMCRLFIYVCACVCNFVSFLLLFCLMLT